MLERFVAYIVRKRSEDYLNFYDAKDVSIKPNENPDENLLLYIHIPFCESLCPYCSFNRYLFSKEKAIPYFKALREEIKFYHDFGYNFSGIYIGGGTPTVMIDELKETVLHTRSLFGIKEISIETNPNHITDKKIKILKEIGTGRLSVGVQSFDDKILKDIGRYDSYGCAADIKEKLKSILGVFDTLNIDLIFNIPTQDKKSIINDIETVYELGIDQVTWYPLMPSSRKKSEMKKALGKIDYAKEKDFYFTILDSLSKDYVPSSSWCFSKKGENTMIDEYILNYYNYVGAGAGSFGYLYGTIYGNAFLIDQYIDLVKNKRFPIIAKRDFSLKERASYHLLVSLFGKVLRKDEFRRIFGKDIKKVLSKEISFLKLFGFIKEDEKFIRSTKKGMYIFLVMMREFFTSVNNLREYCRERVL